MYIHLQNKLCKELEAIEEKYRNGAEMSEGDLRKIDLLTHAMKSLKTYVAMKEAEDYNYEQNQRSYAQGPSRMSTMYNHNYNMPNSYSRDNMSRDSYYNGPRETLDPYRYQEERRW